MNDPNITCAYCKHRHPRGMPCAIASRQAQNAAIQRWDAQLQWAENRVREALDNAVLDAVRQLQQRGIGAIRIAIVHDEITITQEDL